MTLWFPVTYQYAGNNKETSQQKEMEFRQINRESNAFHQSVAATNHRYMKNELLKERQSKVTFPDELLRIHGNFTATNR
jgi:hypothetical protein